MQGRMGLIIVFLLLVVISPTLSLVLLLVLCRSCEYSFQVTPYDADELAGVYQSDWLSENVSSTMWILVKLTNRFPIC
jgi:hypothetical protein